MIDKVKTGVMWLAIVSFVVMFFVVQNQRIERLKEENTRLTAQHEFDARSIERITEMGRQETIIVREEAHAVQQIEAADGADVEVPPAVADAWYAGIVGLCDGGRCPGSAP